MADDPAVARSRRHGLIFAALGAVAFSAKAVLVKLGYAYGSDAVTLIMLRMAFALPLFLALAWWAGRGQPALAKRDRLAVFGLGFCGYYLASMLDFLGLQFVSAGLGRLIQYLLPTFVLLLGWLLHARRPTAAQVAAVALGYAGMLLVFGREWGAAGSNVALGAALVLASTLSYATYLVYSGQVVRRVGAMRLTGLATSVACVFALVQYAVVKPLAALATIGAPVVGLSVLNAVACTFVPVLLVMLAIERVGPAITSQVGMIGPVTTILLGAWLLGEPLTAWTVTGAACVLAGVTLLARTPASEGER